MRISFLGGTDEIGASCLLVEMAHKRILVDCGVRQGARARDPLPDLALTQAAGGVDAIVVTHAHFDHTGALPVVHAAYPQAPVWSTDPTRELTGILLRDSLKIMGTRADADGDVPLYPAPAVDSLLARMQGHRFLEPAEIVPGVSVTYFPAGHILGAAAVGFESSDGRLLISGDISVADQLTVPGMAAPKFRADAVVVESTYGDRLHANRVAEERRLIDALGQVIARGGKVLIPAFAIGRAQEVILILRRAMAKKAIAPFPIHVDGMVRTVCETYAGHPDWLAGALKRRIEKKGNPFWGEDEWVRPIRKPEERAAVLAGPPCVIVASSGMLTGGASAFYAASLAAGEKNLIAITGYQDEESPGRKLLDLAEGRSSTLFIGGRSVAVSCAVTKYSLSAHADSGEIAGLVDRLEPKNLILVHGEGESRAQLARKLATSVRHDIHLPALGESLALEYRRPRPARTVDGAVPPGEPLTREHVARLADQLASDPAARAYALADLTARLCGSAASIERREELRRLLAGADGPFEADPRRPYLFRRRGLPVAPGVPASPGRDEAGRLEQNEALALVDSLLGPASGLIRKGAQRDGWQLVLSFDFPDVARRSHQGVLAELGARSGWAIAVHPEANHARLAAEALRLAPAGWPSGRSPAIFRDERRVVVFKDPALPDDPELAARAAEEFKTVTGWTLAFREDDAGPRSRARESRDPSGRLEINLAYEAIRQAFRDRPHQPRKVGLKTDEQGPAIEVSFVSREIAARQAGVLEQVALRTGWPVRASTRADQQEILRLARELIPKTWKLRKPIGLDTTASLVRVLVAVLPEDGEVARVSAEIQDRCGFRLVVSASGS